MTAFNARLRPKMWFGLPAYTVGGAFVALPAVVLATMVENIVLVVLLWGLGGCALLFAIVFLILGSEVHFVSTMLASTRENNNVTAETWTHE